MNPTRGTARLIKTPFWFIPTEGDNIWFAVIVVVPVIDASYIGNPVAQFAIVVPLKSVELNG